MQIGQPAREVVGEIGPLGLAHAVVGVGVAASGPRGVRVAVLLAVQVRHRVHREVGPGELHEPAGESVVVDVRMRHHDPGDIAERVSGTVEARLHRGEATVGQLRAPHPTIDDRHALAVGEQIHVDAVDRIDPDRQRDPGDALDRVPVDDRHP